jgi:hypothetical protein
MSSSFKKVIEKRREGRKRCRTWRNREKVRGEKKFSPIQGT